MNFSFDSIREWLILKFYDITGSTKKLFRVGEYAETLSLISYMHELYTIYAETHFRELSWKDAQKRSSLIRLAFIYNYVPHRKKGASDYITISVDPTFAASSPVTYSGGNVAFARWTVITDENSTVSFYTTDSGQYLSGQVAYTKAIDVGQSALNLGSGKVGIPVTAHGFSAGNTVSILGSSNYNGYWSVDSSSTTNTVVILTDFNTEVFTATATISKGTIDVPIKEGVPKTYFYTALGTVGETFKIAEANTDNDEIEVLIVDADRNVLNTVTVLNYPSESLYFENDIVTYKCEIRNSPNFDYIEFKFGDGVKSRKLNLGEYVLVKFATTQGSLGKVDSSNTLTKFQLPIRDINGTTVNLYCTNRYSIEGGADYEDIESIRYNAPRNYNINDNATTGTRWEDILNDDPLVLKAKVWSDYDVGILSSTNNIVHIAAISNIGGALSNEQQTAVGERLKQKKSVTEILSFEALEIIHSRFYISGGVINVAISTVENEIKTILLNNFDIKVRDFNANIYSLPTASLINPTLVPNLLYYTFDIKHVEKSEIYPTMTAAFAGHKIIVSNSASDGETNLEHQVYIKPFSVEIWFKRKVAGVVQPEVRAAYTNPANSVQFLGDNSYTLSGVGSINYTDNILAVTITNPPAGVLNPNDSQADGYWIRLVYQTQNGEATPSFLNDIRLPENFQITDCDTDDVVFALHTE